MAEGFRVVARIVVDDATDAGLRAAQGHIDAVGPTARRAGQAMERELGRGARGAADQVRGSMGQLQNSIGEGFSRVAQMAVAAGASLWGLKSVAGWITSAHDELDTLQGGMATLMSAQLGLPMEASLSRSRELMRGLSADAAAGVGELRNYAEGAARILGPANAAGKSAEDLRALTRNALAAGMALRGDDGLNTAAFDVAQALSGNVSDQETPIVAAALAAAGVSQEKFLAMSVGARFDTLNRAFGLFDAGVALMGQTWGSQVSTLFDGLNNLMKLGTRPLFDRWLSALQGVNGWLGRHQAELSGIVELVGGRLASAWDRVAGLVTRIAGDSETWLGRLAGAGGSASGAIEVGAVAAGVGAVGAVGGATAGAAAAASFPLWLGMMGAFEEYPAVFEQLAAAGASIGAAFGRLVGTFGGLNERGSILNGIGAGVIWVLAKMGEWLAVLIDVGNAFFITLQGLLLALGGLALMGRGLIGVLQGIGLSLWDAATAPLDALLARLRGQEPGPRPTRANDAFLEGLTRLEVGAGKIAAQPGQVWTQLDELRRGEFRLTATPLGGLFGGGAGGGAGGSGGAGGAPAVSGKGNVVLTGPVHIEVKAERMDDPDRVALAFEKFMERLERSRGAARRGGFSFAGG